jgi:hypothetical protein
MFASVVATTLLTAPTAPVPAEPRYYFILFGGQSIPFKPRTAHTWATFVKATPAADGTVTLESQTISWLPAEGPVQPWRLRSVEGKNHSLEETFAIAANNSARVSMWGPFETDATRYALAVQQANALDSGTVRFRSFDSLGRNRSVQHCVHAVTFADPNVQRLRQPVIRVGEPDTSKLAGKYAASGAFIGTETHDWLIPALGLDKVGVVRREPGEHIRRQWR